ncbi:MAG: bifunctional phosphopantothenoylcysteine decarboxylase/phosphopantothenate--cysteine ligase CoaBC [Bacteriovoracaceae bacterium]|jgi:phosphopantothenoylcysteine decarboxylase/phosphopantothenate--cysteine ligase|nr:bifunctional phosphopantothenoylcysteine decarboxylase/phosphopantothenate--cysteine ligase CoaBC [Bacteriovoracaceae bacterium]
MNIILGVCGSISAYKSYELLRLYIKNGHDVKVILTKGANEFVHLNVFKYLGAKKVYNFNDDFNHQEDSSVLHIDLKNWADKIVIAPASANTIAKIAAGVSDDLLTSVILANTNPIYLYPAMNTKMLENSLTKRNLEHISNQENINVFDTQSGVLACGDIGAGKLLDIENIFYSSIYTNQNISPKNILITTGATRSYLDPVRYLTNPSSGKTGIELAKSYLLKGHKVTLICGHEMFKQTESFSKIRGLKIIHTQTNEQMFNAVSMNFDNSDIYISAAAIGDIKFNLNDNKIKKDDFTGKIEFSKDTDILKTISKQKKHQKIIGFAAETNIDEDKLIQKMKSKNLDLLIGNPVNSGATDKQTGFGQDENTYFFIDNKSKVNSYKLHKSTLADMIRDWNF